ncbi:HD domain-containing protein [Thermoproteota archaeon]
MKVLYQIFEEISRQLQDHIGCHGYEHTERVIKICKTLGKTLGADMEILIPAAIFHDIGRGDDNHAKHSAEMARIILKKNNYSKINEIVHAIEEHSYSDDGKAKTLEAKILSDADKLDAMGAIGAYRAAQFGVEHNRLIKDFISHFHEKLLKLKDLLYTEEAKKLAEQRYKFMQEYLDQLVKELKGLS